MKVVNLNRAVGSKQKYMEENDSRSLRKDYG